MAASHLLAGVDVSDAEQKKAGTGQHEDRVQHFLTPIKVPIAIGFFTQDKDCAAGRKESRRIAGGTRKGSIKGFSPLMRRALKRWPFFGRRP
jgi:hypothetical protein